MTESADNHVLTPLEVAETVRTSIAGKNTTVDLFAEDAVYETPFTLPGAPERIEGRAAIVAHMKAAAEGPAAAALEIKDVTATFHPTRDPEVVVMEFRVSGVSTTEQKPFDFASSIGVLTVRHGKIQHWRDYPNMIGGAAAAGFLKQFAAMLAGDA